MLLLLVVVGTKILEECSNEVVVIAADDKGPTGYWMEFLLQFGIKLLGGYGVWTTMLKILYHYHYSVEKVLSLGPHFRLPIQFEDIDIPNIISKAETTSMQPNVRCNFRMNPDEKNSLKRKLTFLVYY